MTGSQTDSARLASAVNMGRCGSQAWDPGEEIVAAPASVEEGCHCRRGLVLGLLETSTSSTGARELPPAPSENGLRGRVRSRKVLNSRPW